MVGYASDVLLLSGSAGPCLTVNYFLTSERHLTPVHPLQRRSTAPHQGPAFRTCRDVELSGWATLSPAFGRPGDAAHDAPVAERFVQDDVLADGLQNAGFEVPSVPGNPTNTRIMTSRHG